MHTHGCPAQSLLKVIISCTYGLFSNCGLLNAIFMKFNQLILSYCNCLSQSWANSQTITDIFSEIDLETHSTFWSYGGPISVGINVVLIIGAFIGLWYVLVFFSLLFFSFQECMFVFVKVMPKNYVLKTNKVIKNKIYEKEKIIIILKFNFIIIIIHAYIPEFLSGRYTAKECSWVSSSSPLRDLIFTQKPR